MEHASDAAKVESFSTTTTESIKRKCCDWPKLTNEECKQLIGGRALWNLDLSTDIPKLVRNFCTKNFLCAIDFLNAAAIIAEDFKHHPDLHITSWNTVTVEVYTHSLLGLTQNDFDLASEIDKIDVMYSSKWRKEHNIINL